MRFLRLPVEGAWLIEPELRADERGFFARTWCINEFSDQGLPSTFVQASVSFNELSGTLRGMHYQAEPYPEIKLVRCSAGSIFDVIVDMRKDSPSYLKWCGETLSGTNRCAIYVPKGCAHGFVTLENASEVFYQISEFYQPEAARGVRWDDPKLAIAWPRAPTRISDRDAAFPLLSSAE